MAHPLLRGIEDLRVAVDRRHQWPDEHLRVTEPADEHARWGGPVQIDPVDHRGGLRHEVPTNEDRAARLAAQELRAATLNAQAARNRGPRVGIEERTEVLRRGLHREGEHERSSDPRRPYQCAHRIGERITARIMRHGGRSYTREHGLAFGPPDGGPNPPVLF